MKDILKFIKSTAAYLAGSVLTKAASFFMLPIYTKYLSPADYGAYDLYIAYITFLASILFLDIWGGIMRFMFDYKTDEEKSQPIFVGMTIFVFSSIPYIILVFILGNVLDVPYIGLLLLYGLLTNFCSVIGYVARALEKNKIFALGGFAGSLTNICCNILFVAILRYGYEYLYVSYCIGMLVNVLIIGYNIHFIKLLKRGCFDKQLFLDMLRFSAPLSLNSAAYWFLANYNKVVINNRLSTAENGLYAIANKFGLIVNLITSCFQMAWQELTFSKADKTRAEMDSFYTKAVNEYIRFLTIGTILVLPLVKIVFPYFIDPSYYDAEVLVPLALIASLLTCISSFLASILSTIKKNRMIFTTTLTGSIVNIVAINLLIGSLATQAASIALSLGYLAIVWRRLSLVKKYITIRLNSKIMIGCTLIMAVACVIYFSQSDLVNAVFMLVVCCGAIFVYREMILNLVRALGKHAN